MPLTFKLGCWLLLLCFAIVGLTAGVTSAHAETDADDPTLVAVATEASVDPLDLLGAANTTQLAPRDYLIAVGELAQPVPRSPREYLFSTYPTLAARINCIIQGVPGRVPGESGWNPNAWNPQGWPPPYYNEHASGLLQFLGSTMRSLGHPESWLWDPYRSIDAAVEMFERRREREFNGVAVGVC